MPISTSALTAVSTLWLAAAQPKIAATAAPHAHQLRH